MSRGTQRAGGRGLQLAASERIRKWPCSGHMLCLAAKCEEPAVELPLGPGGLCGLQCSRSLPAHACLTTRPGRAGLDILCVCPLRSWPASPTGPLGPQGAG